MGCWMRSGSALPPWLSRAVLEMTSSAVENQNLGDDMNRALIGAVLGVISSFLSHQLSGSPFRESQCGGLLPAPSGRFLRLDCVGGGWVAAIDKGAPWPFPAQLSIGPPGSGLCLFPRAWGPFGGPSKALITEPLTLEKPFFSSSFLPSPNWPKPQQWRDPHSTGRTPGH